MDDTFERLSHFSSNKTNTFEPHILSSTSTKSKEPAPQEVEMISQQALLDIKQKAHEEGYQAGIAQAQAEVDNHLNQLKTLILSLVNPKQHLSDTLRVELIALATWIAEQVINAELSVEPNKLVDAFEQLCQLLPSIQELTQLEAGETAYKILQPLFESDDRFEENQLTLNKHLGNSDMCLVTGQTQIDTNVEKRVAKLVQQILVQGGNDV